MKKRQFLTIAQLLFMLLSFTNAVAGEGKVVTIRVYECTLNCDSKIVTSTNGEQKHIPIEKTKGKPDNIIDAINNTLEKYYKEGYKIDTSNSMSASGPGYYSITTYILTK